MRLDIRFPVMARMTRKGLRGERRMVVAHVHRQDVPDVSRGETELAVPPVIVTPARNRVGVARELRLHEGRLYRYIGVRGIVQYGSNGSVKTDLLSRAFGREGIAEYVHTSNPDGAGYVNDSPVSNPVLSVFRHRIEAMGMMDTSSRNRLWPRFISWSDGYNGIEENEKYLLSEVSPSCLTIDGDDLAESFEMHRAQADRLLMIDGELWYETKPPCIEVETFWQSYRPGESDVRVRYRYMPDTMDQNPTALYFTLENADLAMETAEKLRKRFRMKSVVTDLPRFHSCEDPSFDFDTTEDLVNRTGQALSMSLLKYAAQRPEKMEGLQAGWLAGISEMFHRDNPVVGRAVDYAQYLPSLVENFLTLSPYKFGGLNRMQNAQIRKTLPLVLEMMDDMPISFHGLGEKVSFAP